MTAQGGDLLAWLDNAITERERVAQVANVTDPSPWTADIAEGTGLLINAEGEPLWDCETSSALCMTATASAHAALNDPASVLRRCAADRKLLELHAPTTGYNTHGGSYPACSACGAAEEYPVRFPCPTVLAIAEGYGWTEGER